MFYHLTFESVDEPKAMVSDCYRIKLNFYKWEVAEIVAEEISFNG